MRRADRLYSSALRERETARILFELGAVRRLQGQSEQACELIRRAIRAVEVSGNPDAGELSRMWAELGTAEYRRGRYLDAERAHSKAWDLEAGRAAPETAHLLEILSALGADFEHLGRHGQTETIFARIEALSAGRRLDPQQQAVLLNNQGSLRRFQGRLEEAEAALRRGVTVAGAIADPKDASKAYLLSNLGLVLLERKQYAEARAAFAQSVELVSAGVDIAPEDIPQLLRNYAACLEKTGTKKRSARADGAGLRARSRWRHRAPRGDCKCGAARPQTVTYSN